MKKSWTGERLETFISNETMLEHLHRYAIAMDLVKGKIVLDIACGEGYGAHLLSTSANHVTAVDIDEPTIKKASKKYPAANISFKIGSAVNIPAQNNSFEVITCFETIEHIKDHQLLLSELKRVLTPNGVLLISTPEKLNYSDKSGYKNPFHEKELYGDEFQQLLNQNFSNTSFYRQTPIVGSLVINEKSSNQNKIYSGNYEHINSSYDFPVLYWLGIASDNKLPILDNSIFNSNKTIAEIMAEQTTAVHQTITYRTGNFLLSPLKFIYSLLKK